MAYFNFLSTIGSPDRINHYSICTLCGALVEHGALNIVGHFDRCVIYREKTTIDTSPEAGRKLLQDLIDGKLNL